MAKLPISFQKIKMKDYQNNETVKYLVTVSEKGSYWEKTAIVDRADIVKLRDELEKVLLDSTTSEILQISEEKAARIDSAHKNDEFCKDCAYKMTHDCVTCLFELQSPLERRLFLELRRAHIYFKVQYGLNWQGQQVWVADKAYDHPTNNFKDVLTIVDFYIEKHGIKLCVYTDGHTYHERTEEQAQRDRNIDRKLQELGFQVLRYTGKDVQENPDGIINDIKNWTEKGYR
jgi:hypothetical protein